MANRSEIVRRWRLLSPYLNRRQRSLWAAAEAEAIGYGGCVLLSNVTGISKQTISAGMRKLRLTKMASAGSLIRVQRSGRVGRKLVELKDPDIESALERMLSDEVAGDPMGCRKWVRSSLRHLSQHLKEQGHQAGISTVARLLRKMGYSLRVNKKELIGNYRREGESWRRKPIEVDSYFASYAQCVAVPFGIYDIAQNTGYVTVGISNNTSEFAVNCLESWWSLHGRSAYPHGDRLLVLADGGGANGYNLRTWKKHLQDRLCDAFGLTVTLSHYPPGCSKWNPVEYRLFSHISINWAGQPLRNLDVMLAFIRGTTTTAGLKVEARLDQEIYRKGRKVTDRQLKELALSTHDVCPRWNYTLTPRLTCS